MTPAEQGINAVIKGLWLGFKPYIIPTIIGLLLTTILCIAIINIVHRNK